MNILIAGATGFIGSKLVRTLLSKGYNDIRILTRNLPKVKAPGFESIKYFKWNPEKGEIDKNCLSCLDVVVNLAGDNIASGRWSAGKKERILNSRVASTRLLVDSLNQLDNPPQEFLNASAIGIYGDQRDKELDEKSERGNSFLAEVCSRWEQELNLKSVQSYILRIGIVLGSQGGALAKMLLPFKMGLGGRLGEGNQFMSWIHVDDLVNQMIYLIEGKGEPGVYNGVAPEPVTNKDFTRILGQTLKRPTPFPVPRLALKVAMGEMSALLLESQRVTPTKFLKAGFEFKYPQLGGALDNLIS